MEFELFDFFEGVSAEKAPNVIHGISEIFLCYLSTVVMLMLVLLLFCVQSCSVVCGANGVIGGDKTAGVVTLRTEIAPQGCFSMFDSYKSCS